MNTVSAVRARPLSQCLACLVASTPGQQKTLETLATRTGFGGVSMDETGAGFPGAADRRMPYFFFHSLIDDTLLRDTLARIRTDDHLRFCPAILVIGEISMNDAVRYIGLGFDDIVTLPESARVLERRFTHQLSTPIHYFEAGTYFGPDRRRARRDGDAPAQKRPGEFRYVRYLIQRSATGVDILRREVLLSSNPAPVSTRPAAATVGVNV